EAVETPCGNCDTCTVSIEAWDATEAARQALSAIHRTGQRYGVGYLTDVLQGRDNDRVKALGHQRLSVFGIGKALTDHQWRSLFRQLVARGLIDVDVEGFGGLRLAESCRPLLRGETTLFLRRELAPQARTTRSTSQASQLVRSHEREMWEALRTLRRQLAEQHSVPPYVIFPDSTLLEMLREAPEDLVDMAKISGVGARKLERYGEAFLKVLNQPETAASQPSPTSQDLRHELVTLARSGMTPEQISQQMHCSLKNVYALMAQAIAGNLLSLEQA